MASNNQTKNNQAPLNKGDQASTQPIFSFIRHYIKDLSLEFPTAPQVFTSSEKSNLELNLNTDHNQHEQNIYEVELTAKARVVTEQDKKILMLIECKYGGLFEISNFNKDDLEFLLNVHAMEIVFPFLRETISNLSLRTSLQPILMPPTNFNNIYQQRKKTGKTQ